MKRILSSVIFLAALILAGCASSEPAVAKSPVYVPQAPDYSDPRMWHIITDRGDSGVDIFYIPSTWEFDWQTSDGITSHWADPVGNPQHRTDVETEMRGIAEYMADGNRFYSPHYRHITLDSWATLNEDTISRRYGEVAFADVRAAFTRFLEHYSQGRPFIIAGFSQGGKSVVELMKILTTEQQSRMVAAYVMGYKVTPDDIAAAPWIKAAGGADDTGVTICYNSVSDPAYIKPVVSAPCVMCINPVNWATDNTPATLDGSITVTLSPAHNVLVVEGYDGSALPDILGILNNGDYHGAEPWLYSDCLRTNIRTRIASYLNER